MRPSNRGKKGLRKIIEISEGKDYDNPSPEKKGKDGSPASRGGGVFCWKASLKRRLLPQAEETGEGTGHSTWRSNRKWEKKRFSSRGGEKQGVRKKRTKADGEGGPLDAGHRGQDWERLRWEKADMSRSGEGGPLRFPEKGEKNKKL